MRDLADTDFQAAPTLPAELMLWLSPAFPVGAFAYSHGLEYAAQTMGIGDRSSLETWLGDLATSGSLRTDLILLAEAWCATVAADWPRLDACNSLALALQPSAERHLETVGQGNAFVDAIAASWPAASFAAAVAACACPDCPPSHGPGGDIAYPIAVGVAAAAHTIALDAVLYGYAVAFASNLVSASIRLSIVGQTDGQRVVAALLPLLRTSAGEAARSSLDDIGTHTFAADLASLCHETQYTRLFRS